MSLYKCVYSFATKRGKRYNYGDKIYQAEYDMLDTIHKGNFRKDSDDAGYSILDSTDFYTPDITDSEIVGEYKP